MDDVYFNLIEHYKAINFDTYFGKSCSAESCFDDSLFPLVSTDAENINIIKIEEASRATFNLKHQTFVYNSRIWPSSFTNVEVVGHYRINNLGYNCIIFKTDLYYIHVYHETFGVFERTVSFSVEFDLAYLIVDETAYNYNAGYGSHILVLRLHTNEVILYNISLPCSNFPDDEDCNILICTDRRSSSRFSAWNIAHSYLSKYSELASCKVTVFNYVVGYNMLIMGFSNGLLLWFCVSGNFYRITRGTLPLAPVSHMQLLKFCDDPQSRLFIVIAHAFPDSDHVSSKKFELTMCRIFFKPGKENIGFELASFNRQLVIPFPSKNHSQTCFHGTLRRCQLEEMRNVFNNYHDDGHTNLLFLTWKSYWSSNMITYHFAIFDVNLWNALKPIRFMQDFFPHSQDQVVSRFISYVELESSKDTNIRDFVCSLHDKQNQYYFNSNFDLRMAPSSLNFVIAYVNKNCCISKHNVREDHKKPYIKSCFGLRFTDMFAHYFRNQKFSSFVQICKERLSEDFAKNCKILYVDLNTIFNKMSHHLPQEDSLQLHSAVLESSFLSAFLVEIINFIPKATVRAVKSFGLLHRKCSIFNRFVQVEIMLNRYSSSGVINLDPDCSILEAPLHIKMLIQEVNSVIELHSGETVMVYPFANKKDFDILLLVDYPCENLNCSIYLYVIFDLMIDANLESDLVRHISNLLELDECSVKTIFLLWKMDRSLCSDSTYDGFLVKLLYPEQHINCLEHFSQNEMLLSTFSYAHSLLPAFRDFRINNILIVQYLKINHYISILNYLNNEYGTQYYDLILRLCRENPVFNRFVFNSIFFTKRYADYFKLCYLNSNIQYGQTMYYFFELSKIPGNLCWLKYVLSKINPNMEEYDLAIETYNYCCNLYDDESVLDIDKIEAPKGVEILDIVKKDEKQIPHVGKDLLYLLSVDSVCQSTPTRFHHSLIECKTPTSILRKRSYQQVFPSTVDTPRKRIRFNFDENPIPGISEDVVENEQKEEFTLLSNLNNTLNNEVFDSEDSVYAPAPDVKEVDEEEIVTDKQYGMVELEILEQDKIICDLISSQKNDAIVEPEIELIPDVEKWNAPFDANDEKANYDNENQATMLKLCTLDINAGKFNHTVSSNGKPNTLTQVLAKYENQSSGTLTKNLSEEEEDLDGESDTSVNLSENEEIKSDYIIQPVPTEEMNLDEIFDTFNSSSDSEREDYFYSDDSIYSDDLAFEFINDPNVMDQVREIEIFFGNRGRNRLISLRTFMGETTKCQFFKFPMSITNYTYVRITSGTEENVHRFSFDRRLEKWKCELKCMFQFGLKRPFCPASYLFQRTRPKFFIKDVKNKTHSMKKLCSYIMSNSAVYGTVRVENADNSNAIADPFGLNSGNVKNSDFSLIPCLFNDKVVTISAPFKDYKKIEFFETFYDISRKVKSTPTIKELFLNEFCGVKTDSTSANTNLIPLKDINSPVNNESLEGTCETLSNIGNKINKVKANYGTVESEEAHSGDPYDIYEYIPTQKIHRSNNIGRNSSYNMNEVKGYYKKVMQQHNFTEVHKNLQGDCYYLNPRSVEIQTKSMRNLVEVTQNSINNNTSVDNWSKNPDIAHLVRENETFTNERTTLGLESKIMKNVTKFRKPLKTNFPGRTDEKANYKNKKNLLRQMKRKGISSPLKLPHLSKKSTQMDIKKPKQMIDGVPIKYMYDVLNSDISCDDWDKMIGKSDDLFEEEKSFENTNLNKNEQPDDCSIDETRTDLNAQKYVQKVNLAIYEEETVARKSGRLSTHDLHGLPNNDFDSRASENSNKLSQEYCISPPSSYNKLEEIKNSLGEDISCNIPQNKDSLLVGIAGSSHVIPSQKQLDSEQKTIEHIKNLSAEELSCKIPLKKDSSFEVIDKDVVGSSRTNLSQKQIDSDQQTIEQIKKLWAEEIFCNISQNKHSSSDFADQEVSGSSPVNLSQKKIDNNQQVIEHIKNLSVEDPSCNIPQKKDSSLDFADQGVSRSAPVNLSQKKFDNGHNTIEHIKNLSVEDPSCNIPQKKDNLLEITSQGVPRSPPVNLAQKQLDRGHSLQRSHQEVDFSHFKSGPRTHNQAFEFSNFSSPVTKKPRLNTAPRFRNLPKPDFNNNFGPDKGISKMFTDMPFHKLSKMRNLSPNIGKLRRQTCFQPKGKFVLFSPDGEKPFDLQEALQNISPRSDSLKKDCSSTNSKHSSYDLNLFLNSFSVLNPVDSSEPNSVVELSSKSSTANSEDSDNVSPTLQTIYPIRSDSEGDEIFTHQFVRLIENSPIVHNSDIELVANPGVNNQTSDGFKGIPTSLPVEDSKECIANEIVVSLPVTDSKEFIPDQDTSNEIVSNLPFAVSKEFIPNKDTSNEIVSSLPLEDSKEFIPNKDTSNEIVSSLPLEDSKEFIPNKDTSNEIVSSLTFEDSKEFIPNKDTSNEIVSSLTLEDYKEFNPNKDTSNEIVSSLPLEDSKEFNPSKETDKDTSNEVLSGVLIGNSMETGTFTVGSEVEDLKIDIRSKIEGNDVIDSFPKIQNDVALSSIAITTENTRNSDEHENFISNKLEVIEDVITDDKSMKTETRHSLGNLDKVYEKSEPSIKNRRKRKMEQNTIIFVSDMSTIVEHDDISDSVGVLPRKRGRPSKNTVKKMESEADQTITTLKKTGKRLSKAKVVNKNLEHSIFLEKEEVPMEIDEQNVSTMKRTRRARSKISTLKTITEPIIEEVPGRVIKSINQPVDMEVTILQTINEKELSVNIDEGDKKKMKKSIQKSGKKEKKFVTFNISDIDVSSQKSKSKNMKKTGKLSKKVENSHDAERTTIKTRKRATKQSEKFENYQGVEDTTMKTRTRAAKKSENIQNSHDTEGTTMKTRTRAAEQTEKVENSQDAERTTMKTRTRAAKQTEKVENSHDAERTTMKTRTSAAKQSEKVENSHDVEDATMEKAKRIAKQSEKVENSHDVEDATMEKAKRATKLSSSKKIIEKSVGKTRKQSTNMKLDKDSSLQHVDPESTKDTEKFNKQSTRKKVASSSNKNYFLMEEINDHDAVKEETVVGRLGQKRKREMVDELKKKFENENSSSISLRNRKVKVQLPRKDETKESKKASKMKGKKIDDTNDKDEPSVPKKIYRL